MTQHFDALITGAGPAGCAAAYDLAKAGKRVAILEKRTFPRPKACACGLTRKTLKALRYPVDAVSERVCHEIVLQRGEGIADKSAEVRVTMREPICALAVREVFDEYCLQQTLAAGDVTLVKIEGIREIRETPSGVEVEVSTADGSRVSSAPVLIGADGSNGQTRRLASNLGRPGDVSEPTWYARGFALEAMVPFADLPTSLPAGDKATDLVFDFAPIAGGYGWLFPKGDHVNIGVGAFAPNEGGDADLKTVTRALLAEYTRTKLGVDLPAQVIGQYLGMGGHRYVPQGRILLAGDAAGLVDPLTGEGIHSAVVSGQAAAAAVLRGGNVAAAYAAELEPLQKVLAFSDRAARAFYKAPERGFKVMRFPGLRGLVLKIYAEGLPGVGVLEKLAAWVA